MERTTASEVTASRSSDPAKVEKDPTTVYFTNTLFETKPIPARSALPEMAPPKDQVVPKDPFFFPLPFSMTGSPKPFINLVHHHVGWDVPKTVLDWNPRKAILRGDPFHMRYQWSTDLMWQCGRLMLGMNVQGPPGNGHGGSIAAVLDDMVGNAGAQAALQMHLEGLLQSDPLFASRPTDETPYIARALESYDKMTESERSQVFLHPSLTIDDLRSRREKRLPYTKPEVAFLISALGSKVRGHGAPSILVGEISCKLKRRVPLLTRLAVRARVVSREGKRIHLVAEIWGKKSTRLTALEPDVSGEWEGSWDVLLAEGKGVCVILYDLGFLKPQM